MKVSFVIPTYNSAGWLWPSIKSCLDQTHKDIEVVVVNDGSTDSTKEFLDTYVKDLKDERIRVFHTENQGRSAARNFGNSQAIGDILCIQDSDDISYPRRAELMVKKFEKGAQYVYGSAMHVNALEDVLDETIAGPFDPKKASEPPFWNYIVHTTVAFTPEIARRFPFAGGEISALGLDDWVQQTEIHLAGIPLDYVPNMVSMYRYLSSGISKTRDAARVLEVKKQFLESLKIAA